MEPSTLDASCLDIDEFISAAGKKAVPPPPHPAAPPQHQQQHQQPEGERSRERSPPGRLLAWERPFASLGSREDQQEALSQATTLLQAFCAGGVRVSTLYADFAYLVGSEAEAKRLLLAVADALPPCSRKSELLMRCYAP
eukprot:Rhum_TRINITY_DN4316_c0_g1::Rhum_TRINITY_DN4316_c0_g1_i1::g.13837::m.13837